MFYKIRSILLILNLLFYSSLLSAAELPAKQFHNTSANQQGNFFYIDPIHGSDTGDGSRQKPWRTLEQVITMGLIETYRPSVAYKPDSPLKTINQGAPVKGGDTLILKSGYHGYIKTNAFLFKDWLHITAAANERPILAGMRLNGTIQKVHIKGLVFLKDSYQPPPESDTLHQQYWSAPLLNRNSKAIIQVSSSPFWGKSQDIIIEQNHIATTQKTETWTKRDWLDKAGDGIYLRGVENVSISDNIIKNIRYGIGVDYQSNHSQVVNNTIQFFCGDGIDISSNDLLIEGNRITDCVKVDEHHDDGIQGWSRGKNGKSGMGSLKNVIIRENVIIGFMDQRNRFPGSPQGLGFFDGFYDNFTVERNLIVTNTYHGIAFYGLRSSRIANNTVVDQIEGDKFSPWIRINPHKKWGNSSNNFVYNNIAHRTLAIESDNTQVENNFIIGHNRFNLLYSLFVSPENNDYHIQPNKFTLKYIIKRGKPRNTKESPPSIGAFEYNPE